MWRHPLLKTLVAVYVVWGGWNWYIGRPVHCPDGILAPAEPQQGDVASVMPSRIGRWTLTPRATYQITARILGVERYHVDFLAPLVPEDLALGWGPMSDNRILNGMDISQANRFYFWRATPGTPVSKEVIISHSANTHVIPDGSSCPVCAPARSSHCPDCWWMESATMAHGSNPRCRAPTPARVPAK